MMKRFRINTVRGTTRDLAYYEDLFDHKLNDSWQEKAERLQARRWRKLTRNLSTSRM